MVAMIYILSLHNLFIIGFRNLFVKVIKSAPACNERIIDALDKVLYDLRGDNLVGKSISFSDGNLSIHGDDFSVRHGARVIGFGKAAGEMALGLLGVMHDQVIGGMINTDHEVSVQGMKVNVTSHPYPDEATVAASWEITKYLQKHSDDFFIFLVSGGASSLFEVPRVPLPDYIKVMKKLMRGGASIEEMNAVRLYLSEVKGGKLLKKFRGECISLIISDVLSGPEMVGSGPTYRIEVFRDEVVEILSRYSIDVNLPEEPGEPEDAGECHSFVLADNMLARQNLADLIGAKVVSESIIGDVRAASDRIADFPPGLYVLGGETTVDMRDAERVGRGGRNQELALLLSLLLDGENFTFLSVGTDGIDGNSDAAGAMVNGNSAAKLRRTGIDVSEILRSHNSYFALKTINSLIFTGPTGTNVADLMVLIKKIEGI